MNMKITLLISILCIAIYPDNKEILEAMNNNYANHKANQARLQEDYKATLDNNFQVYKDTHNKSFKYYSSVLQKQWGADEIKLSNKTQFTQYSDDLKQRETIDYKNGVIQLEILADDNDDLFKSSQEFQKTWDRLRNETISSAIKRDPVNKLSTKYLKGKNIIQSSQKNQDLIISYLKLPKNIDRNKIKSKYTKVNNKRRKIFYINIPLPSNHIQSRAGKYKNIVQKYSRKFNIETATIFGIIHTESYFNPVAKSHIPAFGLMQIVPQTAGKDAYYSLYRKNKLLSSNYLFNSDNNIKIGVKYIQIIQTKYLKGIKNKQNLLYATAISYNAGIGSLIYSLTGKRVNGNNYSTLRAKAIRKINTMSPRALYRYFRNSRHLREEARNYVKRVADKRKNYLAWNV